MWGLFAADEFGDAVRDKLAQVKAEGKDPGLYLATLIKNVEGEKDVDYYSMADAGEDALMQRVLSHPDLYRAHFVATLEPATSPASVPVNIVNADEEEISPETHATLSGANRKVGETIRQMDDVLFAQRRRIIDLLYEAKRVLGMDLPRIKVRIVDYTTNNTMGLCHIDKDYITVSAKLFDWSEDTLRHIVWHELAHAWFNAKHDDTDPLMATQYTAVPKEQLEKSLRKIAGLSASLHTDAAKYGGREVPLGKPMKGDVKKFKVFVKDPQTGNIKKVNFGDPNMEIKRDNPKRRKNFRSRHNCANPGPRTKARYWSCRMWSKKPVSKIVSSVNELEAEIREAKLELLSTTEWMTRALTAQERDELKYLRKLYREHVITPQQQDRFNDLNRKILNLKLKEDAAFFLKEKARQRDWVEGLPPERKEEYRRRQAEAMRRHLEKKRQEQPAVPKEGNPE